MTEERAMSIGNDGWVQTVIGMMGIGRVLLLKSERKKAMKGKLQIRRNGGKWGEGGGSLLALRHNNGPLRAPLVSTIASGRHLPPPSPSPALPRPGRRCTTPRIPCCRRQRGGGREAPDAKQFTRSGDCSNVPLSSKLPDIPFCFSRKKNVVAANDYELKKAL